MKARLLKQLDKKNLKLILAGFFLALFIPTSLLVYQTYDQIKWEAYHQQRQLAEELATRIDNKFVNLIIKEEARAFANYSFLNVAGEPSENFLQRSPLSNLTTQSELEGIIGYFQIDNDGHFTTPLLPDTDGNFAGYGIPKNEYTERQQQQRRVLDILSANELVKPNRAARLDTKDAVGPELSAVATSKTSDVSDAIVSTDTTASPAVEELAAASSGEVTLEAGLIEGDARSSVQESVDNKKGKADKNTSQSGFDELARKQAPRRQAEEAEQTNSPYSLGKVEDLKLEQQYADSERALKEEKATKQRKEQTRKKRGGKRKEKTALPEQRARPKSAPAYGDRDSQRKDNAPAKIEIFESEVDPFEFSLLQSGQFVLYRRAWRNEHRYIQGILVESKTFLQDTIKPIFQDATLAKFSDLSVAYNGDILSVFSSRRGSSYLSRTSQVEGELLYRTRLSPPFSDVEIIFSANDLPIGPGGRIITWTAIVLFVILFAGFLLMYRMGARQLSLASQQQDFVSAVSHELKTPLTSIRMYGEMLREGWATEEKKKSYYDFIYYESERLSRLIQNILQLARMTRNDLNIEAGTIGIAELIDTIRSKVTSQIERNGFELHLDCDEKILEKKLEIDTDYFSQIIINLVDNAIKFSADAQKKQIDIKCSLQGTDKVSFHIRDYGPGIEKSQLKKIFTLFYRTENELTRKTVGTGIGLALVHQLTRALNGEIDVINMHPGAEFVITFHISDR